MYAAENKAFGGMTKFVFIGFRRSLKQSGGENLNTKTNLPIAIPRT